MDPYPVARDEIARRHAGARRRSTAADDGGTPRADAKIVRCRQESGLIRTDAVANNEGTLGTALDVDARVVVGENVRVDSGTTGDRRARMAGKEPVRIADGYAEPVAVDPVAVDRGVRPEDPQAGTRATDRVARRRVRTTDPVSVSLNPDCTVLANADPTLRRGPGGWRQAGSRRWNCRRPPGIAASECGSALEPVVPTRDEDSTPTVKGESAHRRAFADDPEGDLTQIKPGIQPLVRVELPLTPRRCEHDTTRGGARLLGLCFAVDDIQAPELRQFQPWSEPCRPRPGNVEADRVGIEVGVGFLERGAKGAFGLVVSVAADRAARVAQSVADVGVRAIDGGIDDQRTGLPVAERASDRLASGEVDHRSGGLELRHSVARLVVARDAHDLPAWCGNLANRVVARREVQEHPPIGLLRAGVRVEREVREAGEGEALWVTCRHRLLDDLDRPGRRQPDDPDGCVDGELLEHGAVAGLPAAVVTGNAEPEGERDPRRERIARARRRRQRNGADPVVARQRAAVARAQLRHAHRAALEVVDEPRAESPDRGAAAAPQTRQRLLRRGGRAGRELWRDRHGDGLSHSGAARVDGDDCDVRLRLETRRRLLHRAFGGKRRRHDRRHGRPPTEDPRQQCSAEGGERKRPQPTRTDLPNP